MAITQLPDPPLRSDPDNFAERADAFLAALPQFVDEVNVLAAAFGLVAPPGPAAFTTITANAMTLADNVEQGLTGGRYTTSNSFFIITAGTHPVADCGFKFQVRQPGGALGQAAAFNANGYFKTKNCDADYLDISASYHEAVSDLDGAQVFSIAHRSGSNPYGMSVYYPASSLSNATNWFIEVLDGSGPKGFWFTNGGIHNYSANNVNLSDALAKSENQLLSSIPGFMPKLWDAHKAMPWSLWKYANQSHDDPNMGYTAQGVASAFAEVAPWLVDQFGNTERLGVYAEDLHNFTGAVVTELQYRVDDMNERLNVLERA